MQARKNHRQTGMDLCNQLVRLPCDYRASAQPLPISSVMIRSKTHKFVPFGYESESTDRYYPRPCVQTQEEELTPNWFCEARHSHVIWLQNRRMLSVRVDYLDIVDRCEIKHLAAEDFWRYWLNLGCRWKSLAAFRRSQWTKDLEYGVSLLGCFIEAYVGSNQGVG